MHACPRRITLGSLAITMLLQACANSEPGPTLRAARAESEIALPPSPRGWVKAGTSAQGLLYVSDQYSAVHIYTYPEGKHAGELTGFVTPLGECTDSTGDIFIVAFTGRSYSSSIVYEYAHGGTSPIATLTDPGRGVGCAVDPTTGNLTVSNGSDENNPYDGAGDVAIYAGASGYPTLSYASGFYFRFCGYDDKGNLYLTGTDGQYANQDQLVRLAYDGSTFQDISVNAKLYNNWYPGPSVQWDGKQMTVTSDPAGERPYGPLEVYRLRIAGGRGSVIGTTDLDSLSNKYGGQTWIQDKNFLAIDFVHGRAQASVFAYPGGGHPMSKIRLARGLPWGLAISPPQSR